VEPVSEAAAEPAAEQPEAEPQVEEPPPGEEPPPVPPAVEAEQAPAPWETPPAPDEASSPPVPALEDTEDVMKPAAALPETEAKAPRAPSTEGPDGGAAGTEAPAPWDIEPSVPEAAAGEAEGKPEAPVPSPEAGAVPDEEEPAPMSPEEAQRMFGIPASASEAPAEAAQEPPAAEGTRFSVKVHGGSRDGETVEIQGRLTIGRADENDLVLLSKSVSRRHAELFLEGGALKVRDLGSAAGLRINGAKAREETVGGGDQVEIGDIVLVVEAKKETGAPPPVETPEAPAPAPASPAAPPGPSKPTRAVVKPMIMVMGGPLDGKIIPVVGKVTVGSAKDNDLVFEVAGIEPHHAALLESKGAASVKPLEGAVRVNGAGISGEEPLSKGDAIEVSDILMVVRETVAKVEAEEAEKAPPGPETPPSAPSSSAEAPPVEKPKEETPPLGIGPLPLEAGAVKEGGTAGEGAEASKFRLVIKGGLMDGKSFPVTGTMTIGRESGNTIVLLDTSVSRKHAEVLPEGGGLRIKDHGSSGGLWINGKKVQEGLVTHGDLVRVGHTEIQVRDISYDLLPDQEKPPLPSALNAVKLSREEIPPSDKPSLTYLKGEDKGCHVELRGNVAIGRHKSCDIMIHHDEASGRHAEILLDGKRPVFKDLGSTNGSRVNGVRVSEKYLFHGDRIEVADVEFQFLEAGRPAPVKDRKAPSLIVERAGEPKSTRLRLATYALIGREEMCSVPVRDSEASSEHTAVYERNGAWFVKDLGSTNGTRVNGQRIAKETPLKHADVIRVGNATLTFKEGDKALPTPSRGLGITGMAGIAAALIVVAAIIGVIAFKDTLMPGGGGDGENGTGNGTAEEATLIPNGSFEEGSGGWSLDAGAEVVEGAGRDGSSGIRLGGAKGRDPADDLVVKSKMSETVSSPYYRLSAFVRTEDSRGHCGVRLRWTDGIKPVWPDSYTVLITGTTEDWIELDGTFKAPPKPERVEAMYVEAELVAAGASGVTWFDDVRLERLDRPDIDLRDRPEIRSEPYTVRGADTGVFSVWYYGNPAPFLKRGRFVMERAGGRGGSQEMCSVLEGPARMGSEGYRLRGRVMDFDAGEEAELEQTFTVLSEGTSSAPRIHYYFRKLPRTGGQETAVAMHLTSTPETFDLFNEKKQTLSFAPASMGRKPDIQEIAWRVPGGRVVMGVEPPAGVEARKTADGVDLLVYPSLASGAQIALTFSTKSKARKHAKETLYEMVTAAKASGRLGHFLRLADEYLEKFPETDARLKQMKIDKQNVEAEADRKRGVLQERWEGFKTRAEGMDIEESRSQLETFLEEFSGMAETYQGTDYVTWAAEKTKEARERLRTLMKTQVAAEAKKYLDPAARHIEEDRLLLARLFLDAIVNQGLEEHLTPALKARYDRLRASCRPPDQPLDLEAEFKKVDAYLRLGERTKARRHLQDIIGRHAHLSDDPSTYAGTALKAYKKLKEMED